MANPETSTPVTDNNAPVTPESAKPEPKFTQADVDSIIGNRVKEVKAAERKALLKELGIENADDPDAVKTVKGKLTAAQQAEEANQTELQKLTKLAETESKKRADLEAKIAEMEQKQFINARNSEVNAALMALKLDAVDAKHLRIVLLEEHPELFEGVVDENGKPVDKVMKTLIDRAQREYPKYFQNPAPGSPSNHEGRVPEPNADAKRRAQSNTGRLAKF